MNLSKSQREPQGGLKESLEGRARFLLPTQAGNEPKVFYNAKMSMNRDIAILFSSSHFPPFRQLHVCDPMTASGIRAARYAIENPNVKHVLAADRETRALQTAKTTVNLNGLADRVTVVESDANLLLLTHMKERFDLVDLDPFGSPAPFFENALRATVDSGVIAATATDMGPLTGARAPACVRKYGVRPIRSEFEKELAIRILVACLVTVAGKLELGIEIPFSHATDHYARIYAKIIKGTKSANSSVGSLGFLEYCPLCLRRDSHTKLESIRNSCEDCHARTKTGGPIWLGPIWDHQTVEAMIRRAPTVESSRLSEIQNLLTNVSEECRGTAFYYRTDEFSRKLSLKPPSVGRVLDALHEGGYTATKTHFNPTGFRTNAPCRDIASIFRSLAKEG